MKYHSGCDMHNNFSVFVEIYDEGVVEGPTRVDHGTGELQQHLNGLPNGTPVALETSGRWYWMAEEIERADCVPRLMNARKAKVMMGNTNTTDRLDAEGLAILQKTGPLPEVWIPPKPLRDQREVLRLRMKMKQSRTRWKNRIQATLDQYGYRLSYTDSFGVEGREEIRDQMKQLPDHTRESVRGQLETVEQIEQSIEQLKDQRDEILEDSDERTWLRTIPGIGPMLSATIALEVGGCESVSRSGNRASYGGMTPRPRVHQSGDTRRTGSLRKDMNQTLKWAFFEAANVVIRHPDTYSDNRPIKKYTRLKERKNPGIATGALTRMLAESTYCVLTKKEPYKEP